MVLGTDTLKAVLIIPQNNVAVKILGYVNGLSKDILISDGSQEATGTEDPNYILIPANATKAYEYGEAKDLPFATEYFASRHGIANLRIVLQNEAILNLFERESA